MPQVTRPSGSCSATARSPSRKYPAEQTAAPIPAARPTTSRLRPCQNCASSASAVPRPRWATLGGARTGSSVVTTRTLSEKLARSYRFSAHTYEAYVTVRSSPRFPRYREAPTVSGPQVREGHLEEHRVPQGGLHELPASEPAAPLTSPWF